MKKTFAIVLIAMMAMTAVFAATSTVVDPVSSISGSEESKLEVSFTLDRNDVYYYAFGFTTDDAGTNLDGTNLEVPEAFVGTLGLTYDKTTTVASNSDPGQDIYFYYKARTASPFTLDFTMGDMTISDGGGSLGWSATFAEQIAHTQQTDKSATLDTAIVKSASSTAQGSSKVSAQINKDEHVGYVYGLYKLAISTEKIPMQTAGTKTIAGTLTVGVRAE